MWYRIVVVASALGAVACAATTSRTSEAGCVLMPGDSVHLARGLVYRNCAVERRARLLTTYVHPDFRPVNSSVGTACYSAQIEFVVDSTGVPEPESARVVQTNDQSFAVAVLAILPRWRYQPARKDGRAVRQIVRERQSMGFQVMRVRAGDIPRPGRAPRC